MDQRPVLKVSEFAHLFPNRGYVSGYHTCQGMEPVVHLDGTGSEEREKNISVVLICRLNNTGGHSKVVHLGSLD